MDTITRIFELISENDMEQKEFAKTIGVVPQTVTDWKNGKSKSYTKYLPQIAEVLGTTPTYLLTGKNEIYPPNLPGKFFRYKILQLCNEAEKDPYTLMRELSVETGPIRKQASFAEEFHWRSPRITERNVAVLSEYFHVPAEDFFVDGKVPDWNALKATPLSFSQESLAIVDAYEKADERSRAIVRLALNLEVPSSSTSK